MNCERVEQLFSDYYDDDLSIDERLQVEDHLGECAACTQEFGHFKTSLNLLRATGQIETSAMFATGVVGTAQREVPASPRPRASASWLPAAIAAGLAAAFFGGYLLRKSSPAQIREIVREVPGPVLAKPLTWEEKQQILRDHGLVKSGDRWLPRSMKEEFERGKVCIAGEMVSPDDAFARLSVGREKTPDHVPGKVDLEVELAKVGYVKVGKNFVPQEWLEAWSKGGVQVGANEWKTADEFKSDFMKDHNLVEYKGTIMSREHADELQAQRILRRPERSVADNELTSALVGLEIGPPSTYKNLTLVPLLTSGEAREADFIPLHASLEGGRIELTDTGAPFEVRVVNTGDDNVLLAEGEVLAGGRYARVVTEDTLVPPKKPTRVPVYCVEPGALRRDEKFTAESGHYFASYGLRKIRLSDFGQGAVWAQLARQIELSGGKAKSQSEVYRQISSDLFDLRTFFSDLPDRFPDAVGVVICVGDRVEAAEIFRNRATFASYFERILTAASLEAALRSRDRGVLPKPSRLPADLAGFRQLLESPFFSSGEEREGEVLLRRDGRVFGRALSEGGRLVHALLFAEMPAGEPDWRANYKVPAEKLKKVIEEIEKRIHSGSPLTRCQAIYELSRIAGKEATAALAGRLGEADPPVRRAVILALGERRDARVVPPLIEVLDKSKKDRPIYAATLTALAHIGDEKAVDPFLRLLEGEAEPVGTVLQHLPELLLQVKHRELLEKAVGRLIGLHEEAEAIQKGVGPVLTKWSAGDIPTILVALRSALEGVTGSEFETAAKAREWWNKRENREAFLRERTGK